MAIFFVIVTILALIYADDKLGEHFNKKKKAKTVYQERRSNLSFFIDGTQLFADYFAEIRKATHHIHILFYIVKTDEISQQFFQLLKQKAEEGVRVRLLVDWVGSFGFPKKLIRSLKESGVEFAYAHKPRFPFSFTGSTGAITGKLPLLTERSDILAASTSATNMSGEIQILASGAITI